MCVVDRPEMWLTDEQRWFLIMLTCVLATEVCLIESGLKEAFNVVSFIHLKLLQLQRLEFSFRIDLIDQWMID